MESCKLPDVPLFRGLDRDGGRRGHRGLADAPPPLCQGRSPVGGRLQRAAIGRGTGGRVHMEHLDVWGSKTLLGQGRAGRSVCRDLRLPAEEPLLVSVVAAESGEVLLLDTDQLLRCGCEPWRWKMTKNLLRIAARKNLGLAQRNLYTAPKTIRGRITAYFSVLARRSGSMQFNLPFDRQQLADHLGVDRSALSNALSQMQREGLLTLDRRKVELRQVDEL